MDVNEISKDVEALENLLGVFLPANNFDTVESVITGQVSAAKQKAGFHIDGEDFTPLGVDDVLQEKYRRAYDAQQREQASLVRTLDRQIDRTLTATIAAAKTLPSESALLAEGAHEGARQQAVMVDALGDQAARARLAGLSAQKIMRLYEQASDVRDRALVRLLEQEVEEGFPTLQLGQDAENRRHLPDLVAAVQARRAARVPSELHALAQRRAKAMNVQADFFVRHLVDQNRAVALRPKKRRLVVA